MSSLSGSKATNKIIDYLDDLDRKITVNGKLANKILDVRVPKGTKKNFDLDLLMQESKDRGISLIIKEFN